MALCVFGDCSNHNRATFVIGMVIISEKLKQYMKAKSR